MRQAGRPTQIFFWVRRNLFSTPLNGVLTLLCLWILIQTVPPFFEWAFEKATFVGTTRASCRAGGACWVFIKENCTYAMVGFYPRAEMWRIWTCVLLLLLFVSPFFFKDFKHKGKLFLIILTLYPIMVGILLRGGLFGLLPVDTRQWGGLLLTLVVAVMGIVLATPLAVLLALGRRSHMVSVRWFCHVFVEFWRGIPLLLVLFVASVMLPFFLSSDAPIDKLIRVIIGVVLFEAAYLAEVIGGGLQGIPKEQYEAAKTLGLGYWRAHIYIILPQAFGIVIPGLMNIWIALFKDTTLVLVVGLFDLLGAVHSASNNPLWIGSTVEGYVFIGFIYWLFCFCASRYAQRFELQPGRH
ncbi:MAG: amino acid ABC transporter permease [Candidatus Puniceispirillum sp.]|nr:amino acid ABC transporter permease [Candidatus Puniceispirillum sp.]